MRKSYFDSKEMILHNGLQIVSIKKNTSLVSIQIGMRVGAMYEKSDEKGICHFIEHMLFKGTKNRENSSINQTFEERGGAYNAYTDYTSTVFSITALAEELEPSLDILSDILIHSDFPKGEIEKEKKVILSEVKMGIDDVEEFSYRKVNELAFKNSFLRYDVLGTEKNIKKFSKQQLHGFYQKHYIPNQCVISIVSPYEHGEVKEIVQKYFGNWMQGEVCLSELITEKNRKAEKTSCKYNIEQNTLIYLYTFHGLNRKEELALDILNHKLGESANSILFRMLREDKGLAYDIYSEMDATDNIKVLYIYAAVDEKDVWEAKTTIDECIEKIKRKQIVFDEKNISLMKKCIKTGVASMTEDSEKLGSYVLHQKLLGKKIDDFIEDMQCLESIQVEDIYQVAEKVLQDPTVHVLVSKKDNDKN